MFRCALRLPSRLGREGKIGRGMPSLRILLGLGGWVLRLRGAVHMLAGRNFATSRFRWQLGTGFEDLSGTYILAP